MKRLMFHIIAGVSLIFAGWGMTSCSDLLEAEAKDVLPVEGAYRNIDDADAAIRGIYGQLTELAPQYVVLNELRADLLDVTSNAGQELKALSLHQNMASVGDYADARPFFSLINNCNDVIARMLWP
ncbi:MAG: RagB/SusD family nutrient uptake outer membrane protein [Bacteroidales bacterium]|nr:RagB/SusD family nutrient uptake outer membrane protein [Bacteroidales bacterium]